MARVLQTEEARRNKVKQRNKRESKSASGSALPLPHGRSKDVPKQEPAVSHARENSFSAHRLSTARVATPTSSGPARDYSACYVRPVVFSIPSSARNAPAADDAISVSSGSVKYVEQDAPPPKPEPKLSPKQEITPKERPVKVIRRRNRPRQVTEETIIEGCIEVKRKPKANKKVKRMNGPATSATKAEKTGMKSGDASSPTTGAAKKSIPMKNKIPSPPEVELMTAKINIEGQQSVPQKVSLGKFSPQREAKLAGVGTGGKKRLAFEKAGPDQPSPQRASKAVKKRTDFRALYPRRAAVASEVGPQTQTPASSRPDANPTPQQCSGGARPARPAEAVTRERDIQDAGDSEQTAAFGNGGDLSDNSSPSRRKTADAQNTQASPDGNQVRDLANDTPHVQEHSNVSPRPQITRKRPREQNQRRESTDGVTTTVERPSNAERVAKSPRVERRKFSMKAFLMTGEKKLTRRFTVEEDMSFNSFLQELRRYFDVNAELAVTYLDEEGDEVGVSTSNELSEMLAIAKNHTITPLRLSITEIGRQRIGR